MSTWASRCAGLVVASFMSTVGIASAETQFTISTGLDYSSGDYGGEEDTEVIAVPLSARLSVGDWAFRVSSAYLKVDGPANIADNDGDGGSSGVIMRDGEERGFGDTTVSVERSFREIGGSDVYVELAARVRLPTGDDTKGLGVGATDYIAASEIGVSSRNGGAYVSFGYRFLGDNDVDERQDGAQAGVGGWLPAGDRTRVGAFASWRRASIDGNEDPASAGVYVSHRLTDRVRVSLTASGGLSDASADYSSGVRLSWRM